MFNFDERYLCAYLCNTKKINDFNILFNFYQEIAQASLKSKNNMAWQIKLQWFIDALLNDEKNLSPSITDLKSINIKYNFINNGLIDILVSKNIDLDEQPFKNKENLILYAENTGGKL